MSSHSNHPPITEAWDLFLGPHVNRLYDPPLTPDHLLSSQDELLSFSKHFSSGTDRSVGWREDLQYSCHLEKRSYVMCLSVLLFPPLNYWNNQR